MISKNRSNVCIQAVESKLDKEPVPEEDCQMLRDKYRRG
jgi:hypothetical protein